MLAHSDYIIIFSGAYGPVKVTIFEQIPQLQTTWYLLEYLTTIM